MATYKLIWDDLCSWYLESIKPAFVNGVGEPIDRTTYEATLSLFEEMMKLLHPFMPFLTEELWSHLRERKGPGEALIIATWPTGGEGNAALELRTQHAFDLVTAVRNLRNERGISPREPIDLQVKGSSPLDAATMSIVAQLANVIVLLNMDATASGAITFLVGTTEYVALMGAAIDAGAEMKKAEGELTYLRGFLASVDKKLANERFVSGAPPQVLENERSKKADAEAKIKALEARIMQLAG